jgi:hypothetical protein
MNTYNNRQILSNLPNGKFDNNAGPNECCQRGEICMKEGELLSHQTTKEKSCENQTITTKPK